MPKLSYRCSRRAFLPPVATVAFCAPPRKVSFEDGHSDADSSEVLSSPLVHGRSPKAVVANETGTTPKISTLRRPKSSLSLVELVKDTDNENNNNSDGGSSHRHDQGDETMDILVSPRESTPLHASAQSPPLQSPSSPWGYFVDMLIPVEDKKCPQPQRIPTEEGESGCCSSSCRRRRDKPYGDYKRQRESLRFRSIPLPSGTLLAPRKRQEPTDQLVGALDRLQVD